MRPVNKGSTDAPPENNRAPMELPRITLAESLAAALSALTPAVLTYAAERSAGVPVYSGAFTFFIPSVGLCIAWLLLAHRPGYAAGYGMVYGAVLIVCAIAGAGVRLVFPVSTLAVTEVASFIAICVMFLPVAVSLYDERPAFAAAEVQQKLRERLQKQQSEGKGKSTGLDLLVIVIGYGAVGLPVLIVICALIFALTHT